MFGHGRPLRDAIQPAPMRGAWWLVVVLMLVCAASRPAVASSPERATRLRVTWSLSQPLQFASTLDVEQGVISAPRNLCLAAGTTGAIRLSDEGRRVIFAPRGPVESGGMDIHVKASPDARLTLQLQVTAGAAGAMQANPLQANALVTRPESTNHAGPALSKTFALEDCFQTPVSLEIPGVGTVYIRRMHGDSIHADFDRSHLVFQTGEVAPLQLSVDPGKTIAAGDSLEVIATIRRLRTGQNVNEYRWQANVDEAGKLPLIEVADFALPADEGAYDIDFRCVRQRKPGLAILQGTAVGLGGEDSLAESTVQVVVVAPQPATPDDKTFQTIGKIEPLRRAWTIQRILPSMPGVLSSADAPMVSGPLGEELHAGEPVAVLAPDAWYACPLPVESMGRPHVIVVRYPRNQIMKLGVSVVQTDAAGNLPPIGVDSGVATSVSVDANTTSQWAEHRIVYWPHDPVPYLVLTNHDSNEPARFESIQVEAGPALLSAGTTFSNSTAQARASGRLAALYLDKPLLAECFGDRGFYDEAGAVVIEDWQTFLVAARRLADYLKWAGYNGIILTVSSEGGTLYPSQQIGATPRFDNGAFSTSGKDPVQKDVLELLLRVFDREGLRIVPAVELATPLPALEEKIAAGDVGLQPVDALGRPYVIEAATKSGLAPYYNPLHPDVGNAIVGVIGELTQRYQQHASFAGLGLHLGPQTYVQLPPSKWTQDPLTQQRFLAQAAGATVDPAKATAWIAGDGKNSFDAWRTNELMGLYARIAEATAGRHLLLLSADGASDLAIAKEAGLDWEHIGRLPNVVPLRLIRESVFRDVVQQASDAAQNEDAEWDQILAKGPLSGAMVFRPPLEVRARFSSGRPHWNEQKRPHRFVHAIPDADRYRQRLARLMKYQDARVMAVGGWTVPWGQEEASRDILQAFASLPDVAMHSVQASGEHPTCVQIRQIIYSDQVAISAVNVSPWPMSIDVEFGRPIAGESLPMGEPLTGKGTHWQTTLAAGELLAVRIQGRNPIVRWSEQPAHGETFVRQLGERVQELAARVAVLASPRIYPELQNGSFAEQTPRSIPGWMHAQHPPGSIQVADIGADDNKSVVMTNAGGGTARTWIVSTPFKVPATGRLAVSLQVRGDVLKESQPVPQIRIGIEGRARGEPLRRSVTLTPELNGEWQTAPLWLEVADLGQQEIEELRLTIDLLTPGRIWIDNVKLYDFFLTDAEKSAVQNQTFLAVQRLRHGDLSAAAKLLNSHWGQYLMGLRIQDRTLPLSGEPQVTTPMPVPPVGIAERLKGWLPSPLRF
ncbi:hypothetical protein FF011L_06730 [Roseimaritima multifibrata]|uniref:Glycosyl hydrolase-like 10 domain-containing protein n=1 Tax=Roseimaritima multifibrata TaxID=1930274 RepID=A0A517MAW9_9BACT|nr:hypothetical protein [Roseimaritima multifibrata]QDS91937.1 hypothetical protein FF011L_06730 [Roseimaritima multifibrata]